MEQVAAAVVDLQPLIETALGLIATAVMGLAIFAIRALNAWLAAKLGHQNLVNEDMVRGYLSDALDRAVSYAKTKVDDADWSKVDVKSALIAEAARYAMTRVPDAINHFNLTEEDIAEMIEARLGKPKAE